MGDTKRGEAALAFTIANFGVAGLNYFFQVHAAAVLDVPAFGALSTWLARITLAGVVATVVQYVSLDFRVADRQWTNAARTLGAISLLVFLAHVAAGTYAPQAVLSATAVVGGILFYACLGQLQSRLQLAVIALAIFVAALARFALPFAWPRTGRAPAFMMAHAAAAFAGIAVVAAVLLLRRRPTDAPAGRGRSEGWRGLRLRRPMLLAFAASLFPLLDILVISSTQDAATTGAFSRVALAARIVFFCGAAALQILLPYELHAAEHSTTLPAFALQLRRWLTPLLLVLAVVLASALDRTLLHAAGEERTWLRASCISFALLVAILGHVNRFAAHDRLGVAAALVAGVVIAAAGALALGSLSGTPVTRYVMAVVVGEALVLAAAVFVQRRSAAKAPRPAI